MDIIFLVICVCKDYFEKILNTNLLSLTDFIDIRDKIVFFNANITDEEYSLLLESSKKRNLYIKCAPVNVMYTKVIIFSYLKSFNQDLANMFLDIFRDGRVHIGDNFEKSKCYYFNNRKPEIVIKHTNPVYDSIELIHEFVHSLTEYIGLKYTDMSNPERFFYEELLSIYFEIGLANYIIEHDPKQENKELALVSVFDRINWAIYLDLLPCIKLLAYLTRKINNVEVDVDNSLEEKINNEEEISLCHSLGVLAAFSLSSDERDNLTNLVINQGDPRIYTMPMFIVDKVIEKVNFYNNKYNDVNTK